MVIDITTPHIGRIYDYMLGGSHNHEADRRAAQAMMELVPNYPQWARANRAFLSHVGRLWAGEGRTGVLDLGSGLPTQGHFNTCLPAAKILFSDIDPLTVTQAQQILAYSPDMAYVEADLREPGPLFEQAEAFFGDQRRLAVGCVGILYFLSDEQVRHLMARLHAFCAPGSALAFTYPIAPVGGTKEVADTARELSRAARIDIYPRAPAQMAELVAPWRVTANEPFSHWLGPAEDPAGGGHATDRPGMFGALAAHD